MTKAEWVEMKKKEYASEPFRYKTLEELGLKDRMEYDPSRKEINHNNSGYFVRSKSGRIVDLSNGVIDTGYVFTPYSSWDNDRIEARLEKGGRLATGDKCFTGEID